MAISVLTAADSSALIDRATVAARLEIDTASAVENAFLDDLILLSASSIASRLGRELGYQRYREELAGRGRDRLVLARFPVDPDRVSVTVATVATPLFKLETPARGIIYLASKWPAGAELTVAVDFHAGYLLKSQVRDPVEQPLARWQSTQDYSVGDWVRPTRPSLSTLLFEATADGGSSGSTEPVWLPVVGGGTIVDDGITWTGRNVAELPRDLEAAAWLSVRSAYYRREEVPGVTRWQAGDTSESVSADRLALADVFIPPEVNGILERHL